MLNNKNGRFWQFSQTLMEHQYRWTLEISSTNSRREKRDRDRGWKKSTQRSRIRTLKVRYFPRVARNPLREVSYWPCNSIKRWNIEGLLVPYTENDSEIITASSLDPLLFSKRVSVNSRRVEGQITFPRNSLQGNEENCSRKVSSFFFIVVTWISQIREFATRAFRFVVNSTSKIRNIGPDCEKSNWSNGLRVTYG